MTRYLISFDDGAMSFPEEELPDVAEAAHAVVQEANRQDLASPDPSRLAAEDRSRSADHRQGKRSGMTP